MLFLNFAPLLQGYRKAQQDNISLAQAQNALDQSNYALDQSQLNRDLLAAQRQGDIAAAQYESDVVRTALPTLYDPAQMSTVALSRVNSVMGKAAMDDIAGQYSQNYAMALAPNLPRLVNSEVGTRVADAANNNFAATQFRPVQQQLQMAYQQGALNRAPSTVELADYTTANNLANAKYINNRLPDDQALSDTQLRIAVNNANRTLARQPTLNEIQNYSDTLSLGNAKQAVTRQPIVNEIQNYGDTFAAGNAKEAVARQPDLQADQRTRDLINRGAINYDQSRQPARQQYQTAQEAAQFANQQFQDSIRPVQQETASAQAKIQRDQAQFTQRQLPTTQETQAILDDTRRSQEQFRRQQEPLSQEIAMSNSASQLEVAKFNQLSQKVKNEITALQLSIERTKNEQSLSDTDKQKQIADLNRDLLYKQAQFANANEMAKQAQTLRQQEIQSSQAQQQASAAAANAARQASENALADYATKNNLSIQQYNDSKSNFAKLLTIPYDPNNTTTVKNTEQYARTIEAQAKQQGVIPPNGQLIFDGTEWGVFVENTDWGDNPSQWFNYIWSNLPFTDSGTFKPLRDIIAIQSNPAPLFNTQGTSRVLGDLPPLPYNPNMGQ